MKSRTCANCAFRIYSESRRCYVCLNYLDNMLWEMKVKPDDTCNLHKYKEEVIPD